MPVHNLYKQDVILYPDAHKYYDVSGKEYMGFSSLYNFLVPKFDSDFMAGQVAKKEGLTKENVLNNWKSATDEGTRIDNALELYAETGQILKENEDIKPLLEFVLKKYKDYNRCYSQLTVFNHKYRTAGTLDKLSLLSNRKDSKFHLSDYKVFDGGMTYSPKGQAWLNYPFDYFPNTRYTKINIQTSYYTWHFEELTGKKCERIFVDMIIPQKSNGKITGYKNEVIPMPYLKHQIEVMLDHFKDKIINKLDSVESTIMEEF